MRRPQSVRDRDHGLERAWPCQLGSNVEVKQYLPSRSEVSQSDQRAGGHRRRIRPAVYRPCDSAPPPIASHSTGSEEAERVTDLEWLLLAEL